MTSRIADAEAALSGYLAPVIFACVLALAGPHPAWPQAEGQADSDLLNPLSSLDVGSFSGFRDKPLFAPSREPAPAAGTEPTEAPPVIDPDEGVAPNIRLLGVVQKSQTRIALVQDLEALTSVSVQAGDSVGAWLVASVGRASIVVTNGDLKHELSMFQPGEVTPDLGSEEPEIDPGDPAGRARQPNDASGQEMEIDLDAAQDARQQP